MYDNLWFLSSPTYSILCSTALNDFIALSVKAGTLPYDSESMTEEEAIEYYQGLSINRTRLFIMLNELWIT